MSLLLVGDGNKIKQALYPKYTDRPLSPNDPDIIFVETAEPNLGVEEIRQLRRLISTKPATHKTKIIIITESSKLTVGAQNALLKTLEEPPENTLIILIAPNTDFLLPTILSRCQIIFFPTEPKTVTPEELHEAKTVLNLIAKADSAFGFAWAKKLGPDRAAALAAIDKLLIASHSQINPKTVRKILAAKKFLLANTNVRLTLENLFL